MLDGRMMDGWMMDRWMVTGLISSLDVTSQLLVPNVTCVAVPRTDTRWKCFSALRQCHEEMQPEAKLSNPSEQHFSHSFI